MKRETLGQTVTLEQADEEALADAELLAEGDAAAVAAYCWSAFRKSARSTAPCPWGAFAPDAAAAPLEAAWVELGAMAAASAPELGAAGASASESWRRPRPDPARSRARVSRSATTV
jgi:hypothetical protein